MKILNRLFQLKPIGTARKLVCRVCGFPVRPGRAGEHSACEVKALAALRKTGTLPGKGDAR